jgi:hypothetical protein
MKDIKSTIYDETRTYRRGEKAVFTIGKDTITAFCIGTHLASEVFKDRRNYYVRFYDPYNLRFFWVQEAFSELLQAIAAIKEFRKGDSYVHYQDWLKVRTKSDLAYKEWLAAEDILEDVYDPTKNR